MDHDIMVNEDGSLSFVYDDELAALMMLGESETRRVSHVEPAACGGWYADMSPVAGRPVLLGPYWLRQQALDAEREWIRRELGL